MCFTSIIISKLLLLLLLLLLLFSGLIFLSAIIILIGTVRSDLFCSGIDKVTSSENETVFCTISGSNIEQQPSLHGGRHFGPYREVDPFHRLNDGHILVYCTFLEVVNNTSSGSELTDIKGL